MESFDHGCVVLRLLDYWEFLACCGAKSWYFVIVCFFSEKVNFVLFLWTKISKILFHSMSTG